MWAITSWEAQTLWNAVTIDAATSSPAHLYAVWTLIPPSRTVRYRVNRGVRMPCGWEYSLFHTSVSEQNQPGPTLAHTFYLHPIPCGTQVWFIISQHPVYQPGRPTAGLFHYETEPCLMPLPAVQVALTAPQPTASHGLHTITWPGAVYEFGDWSPGGYPRNNLIVPEAGIYIITGYAIWATNALGVRVCGLWSNTTGRDYAKRTNMTPDVIDPTYSDPNNQMRLAAGDEIIMQTYQSSGIPLNLIIAWGFPTSLSFVKIPGTS